jgi:hypothetical protein
VNEGDKPSRTSQWYACQYRRTCRSSDLIICESLACHAFLQLSLTGGGGLAGVDMADDDDVDMSLFLTVEMQIMSVRLIDIRLRLISKCESERR